MKPSLPQTFGAYQVEWLKREDIGQIAHLERIVFPEPLSQEAIEKKFETPGTFYLVVKDQNTIAAYFGFEMFERYAHVIANVTHPNYRRQGLAEFVLKTAEPWAKQQGAIAFLGEVRLSNASQLKVLEKVQWQILMEMPGFFGNGENAYLVARLLT